MMYFLLLNAQRLWLEKILKRFWYLFYATKSQRKAPCGTGRSTKSADQVTMTGMRWLKVEDSFGIPVSRDALTYRIGPATLTYS